MLAYKSAKHDGKRVVITLEIPEDAMTNMNRSTIAVKETAKHRTNKAKVLTIEDKAGVQYKVAESCHYDGKKLYYVVGEVVEETSFCTDLEEVCAEGIHFFLNRRVAELYGLGKVKDGLFESWWQNGQKKKEATYVKNQLHGTCREWYPNGQQELLETFEHGEVKGPVTYWYKNGQKSWEGYWLNRNEHDGLYQEWEEDGQKTLEVHYVNGKIDGTYTTWHDNGVPEVTSQYVNGKKHGLHQEWHENGQKKVEVNYLEDTKHGTYQSWYDNGVREVECHYVKGKLDGVWLEWHENGKWAAQYTYKDGHRVEAKSWDLLGNPLHSKA